MHDVRIDQVLSRMCEGFRLHLPGESLELDARDLRERAGATARALGPLMGDRSTVAAVLDNDAASVLLVMAALEQGLTLVSLPAPARGQSVESYLAFLGAQITASAAACLVVPGGLDDASVDLGVPVVSTASLADGTGSAPTGDGFCLIQFTSGSTGAPRGVVIPGWSVEANLARIIERLDVHRGDRAMSWLPLSHDMGFVGMLLTSLVASDRAIGVDRLTLLSPVAFLRRPSLWMQYCASDQATITAGPDFGLRLAERAGGTGVVHDLSALRVMLVGSEPVRRSSLAGFADAFGGHGLRRDVFCPAYGMAEATLAVALAPGTDPDDASEETVAIGAPLSDFELTLESEPADATTRGEAHSGCVLLRGPSMAASHLDGSPLTDAEGWYRTSDLGRIVDGSWYVEGRLDDVLNVAGRKLLAPDLERRIEESGAVRPGSCLVLADRGDLIGVGEPVSELVDRPEQVSKHLRVEIARLAGLGPRRVCVVARGTTPRTTSGKPRRAAAATALADGSLPILHEWGHR